MRFLTAGIWILLLSIHGSADTYVRQPGIDVVHYDISLELTDSSNSITATAKIRIRMKNDGVSDMRLDFEGMQIDDLRVGGVRRTFTYRNGGLWFPFNRKYSRNEIVPVEVRYHGTPDAGLLIGKNKYGKRVFFTENWPDRAHHWLPSIDHPSDKATVQVAVISPQKYEVVSNGRMVKVKPLRNRRKLTEWVEGKPIPTYCIALGVAEFLIAHQKDTAGVPVDWYSYPQDSEAAARKFRPTAAALAYFGSLIGPYPYEKLAQVQATVSYGGMENSSAIFYKESSMQEMPVSEDPVPHEIAHQWFGDSVTEADWDHLWLSEGFATYFEALFYEHQNGPGLLRQTMADYAKKLRTDQVALSTPIIDPGQTDPMKKLNSVNYDKGAWVLHMLRGMLGEQSFLSGIRQYYRLYEDGNATSDDFEKVLESVSGVSLDTFFKQWLYQPAWPEYCVSWRWDDEAHEVELSVSQTQTTGLFDMALDFVFDAGNWRETRKLRVSDAAQSFRIRLSEKPAVIQVDPDGWVLKNLSVEHF